jgi:hypothetical protein
MNNEVCSLSHERSPSHVFFLACGSRYGGETYNRELTVRQLLKIIVLTTRKRQREEEQQDITKRLKKQDAAATINFTDIAD